MTRLEYAQDLYSKGITDEEFLLEIEKYDNGEVVLEEEKIEVQEEVPENFQEDTMEETVPVVSQNIEESLVSDSETFSSELQSNLEQLDPNTLLEGGDDEEEEKKKNRPKFININSKATDNVVKMPAPYIEQEPGKKRKKVKVDVLNTYTLAENESQHDANHISLDQSDAVLEAFQLKKVKGQERYFTDDARGMKQMEEAGITKDDTEYDYSIKRYVYKPESYEEQVVLIQKLDAERPFEADEETTFKAKVLNLPGEQPELEQGIKQKGSTLENYYTLYTATPNAIARAKDIQKAFKAKGKERSLVQILEKNGDLNKAQKTRSFTNEQFENFQKGESGQKTINEQGEVVQATEELGEVEIKVDTSIEGDPEVFKAELNAANAKLDELSTRYNDEAMPEEERTQLAIEIEKEAGKVKIIQDKISTANITGESVEMFMKLEDDEVPRATVGNKGGFITDENGKIIPNMDKTYDPIRGGMAVGPGSWFKKNPRKASYWNRDFEKNEKQINKLVINRNEEYANFGLITVTGIGLEYNSNGVVTSFESGDYITTFKNGRTFTSGEKAGLIDLDETAKANGLFDETFQNLNKIVTSKGKRDALKIDYLIQNGVAINTQHNGNGVDIAQGLADEMNFLNDNTKKENFKFKREKNTITSTEAFNEEELMSGGKRFDKKLSELKGLIKENMNQAKKIVKKNTGFNSAFKKLERKTEKINSASENILSEYNVTNESLKKVKSDIKPLVEDQQNINLSIEELNNEYTEKYKETEAQIKKATTRDAQLKIYNEFIAWETKDYKPRFNDLKADFDNKTQEVNNLNLEIESIQEGYTASYNEYKEEMEEYKAYKADLTPEIRKAGLEMTRALNAADTYKALSFSFAAGSKNIHKQSAKIFKEGEGRGSFIGETWNSFTGAFADATGGKAISFSYLAELFNEVGRFTGAIGEGEYNANASKIAADQKSFSADVEAVKNIMKIKNIDEKYATTYSESFLGGLADTAAVMLGAYAGGTPGAPMSFGLSAGFFFNSVSNSQQEILDIQSEFIKNYDGPAWMAVQEFEKGFTSRQQKGYILTQASVEAALTYFSGAILQGKVKPFSSKVVKKYVDTALDLFSKEGKVVTTESLNASVRKLVGKSVAKTAGKAGGMTEAGLLETLEEYTQAIAAEGIKSDYEKVTSRKIKWDIADQEGAEWKKQMDQLFKISFTMGAVGGVFHGSVNNNDKLVDNYNSLSLKAKADLEQFLQFNVSNKRNEDALEQYKSDINNQLNDPDNEMDEETASNLKQQADKVYEVYKHQVPQNLTGVAQSQMGELLLKKNELIEEIDQIGDKNAAADLVEQVAIIDAQVKAISLDPNNKRFEGSTQEAVERQQVLGEKIMERRGGGTITFAKSQQEFEQAMEDNDVALQAVNAEGNIVNQSLADAMYLKDGSGNIIVNTKMMEDMVSISATTHEILHDITADQLAGLSDEEQVELINSFKNILNPKEKATVEARLEANYNGVDIATTEEWFNAFHDAIVRGDLKYDKNIFEQLGDWIVNLINGFAPGSFKKDLKFDSPQGVYDFIKNYSIETKAITEGKQDEFSEEVGKVVYNRDNEIQAKPEESTETTTIVEEDVKDKPEVAAALSISVIDETTDNKKARQDTRNIVVDNIYNEHAKGKTNKEWREFVESPKGIALVQDEILAGTVLLDKNNNILNYNTRKEKRELLEKPGVKEVQTSYLPDMVAIAKRKGSEDPMGTAYAGIDFLMNHVKAFDPSQNTDLPGYIGGYLGLKVGSGFKKQQKKGDEISMEKEGVKQVVEKQAVSQGSSSTSGEESQQPQFLIKDRLGDKANAIDKKVKAMASGLNLKGKGYKQTPKLALKETVEMFMSDPKAVYVDDGGSFWGTPKGKKALGTSIAESILNKIDNNAALNGQDIKAVQQFLMKNKQTLMSGALAEGTDPSGKSTGMAKVLLDKFYSKGDRVKMTKTGSKQGLAKQTKLENIEDSVYDDLFGITEAGTPNVQNVSTSSQPVKAMIRATEKILTNQAIRESVEGTQKMGEGRAKAMRSSTQFTQAQDISYMSTMEDISQKRDIKAALKALKIDPKNVIVTDENRINRQVEFEKQIIKYKLNSQVFLAGAFAFSGARRAQGQLDKDGNLVKAKTRIVKGKEVQNPYFYQLDNGKWMEGVKGKTKNGNVKYSQPVTPEGTSLVPRDKSRLYYGTSDPAYIKALEEAKKNDKEGDAKFKKIIPPVSGVTEDFIKSKAKQSAENMNVLESVVDQLAKAKQDGMSINYAAMIVTQGYQATDGLIKVAAPFKYTSKVFAYGPKGSKLQQREGKKYREEHNPPASVVGASLIAAIKSNRAKQTMDALRENYSQTQLSKFDDSKLDAAKLDAVMPKGTSIFSNPAVRYAAAGINLNSIINPLTGKTIAEENGLGVDKKFENDPNVVAKQNELVLNPVENSKQELKQYLKTVPDLKKTNLSNSQQLSKSKVLYLDPTTMTNEDVMNKAATIDEAIRKANGLDRPVKKIRVFDFDDTLARTKSNVLYTMPDGTTGKLTAEEFAQRGEEMKNDGAVWDFSEFNKVMNGRKGPLFEVAQKIQESRGTEDMFVLTARAPESQQAIKDFLDGVGLNIPLKNITGLGNSTGAAKANWVIDKAADGYNDFYFADDHMANVRAVQDALSVVDVKSKVQQAKVALSTSQGVSDKFNQYLEASSGIEWYKQYSKAKAQVLGNKKNKFKFFIPNSAEDFLGLLYETLAPGKVGEQQIKFYEDMLLKPYSKAMSNLSADRVQLMADFKKLKKTLEVPKDLRKKTDSGFTNEQAVRVYLWDKIGEDVPGISKKDLKELLDIVENDPKLKTFGNSILEITKGDGYSKPGQSWLGGTITTDLVDMLNTTKRGKYLENWKETVDAMFSEENLNKLEALYGSKYREALEDIIRRMKSGKNRQPSTDRLTNEVMDWINGSVGTIMFFNMRSALLQGISAANFLNWTYNNPAAAGKAFANQKQYWKDFIEILNSDYLVDRRNGLKLNINESEIADAAKSSRNKAKAVISYIIEKGYLPTKFMDSFAIASGGATFYRNRVNDLIKNEGKSQEEAEAQAFEEFKEKSEMSQQSSDPSKISKQQTTLMGRLLLQFVNTPMQYTRLQKRAFQDLLNGRGSKRENMGKILYYGIIQNMWFNAMQSGLMLAGFGDDDEDDGDLKDKTIYTANGMVDSMLRGLGFAGITVSVLKNLGIDIYDRSQRKRPEYSDAWQTLLQFSPSIRKKLMNLKNAGWVFDSKKRRQEVLDKGFSLDNPAWEAGSKVFSTITNIPLDRLVQKTNNIRSALEEDTETWEAIFILLGWNSWQIKPDKKEKDKKLKIEGLDLSNSSEELKIEGLNLE